MDVGLASRTVLAWCAVRRHCWEIRRRRSTMRSALEIHVGKVARELTCRERVALRACRARSCAQAVGELRVMFDDRPASGCSISFSFTSACATCMLLDGIQSASRPGKNGMGVAAVRSSWALPIGNPVRRPVGSTHSPASRAQVTRDACSVRSRSRSRPNRFRPTPTVIAR